MLIMTYKAKQILIYFSFGMIALGAFAFGTFFFLTHVPWVDLSPLEHYKTGYPSIVLDDEDKEWARFELDQRKPVSLADMPDHLIKAFLAAEDHDFFSHNGISMKGILRSLVVNILRRGKVQGASTITQQLVRLLFFDQKKTFSRKVKEQLLSLAIERQFTKEHILETYLNHIYFGCGIYGVEAASQRFWGKSAHQLLVDESATLAAIIRSPLRNCPLINPENTKTRRNMILSSMKKLGYISESALTDLINKSIALTSNDPSCIAPHAREYVRLFVENIVGKNELYSGGLVIKTSLNTAMQEAAQKAFKKNIALYKKKLSNDVDGALITLNVHNGEIKTLIGGSDFRISQFNRALHARRQMGSIFKPLVYALAVEQGRELYEIETDEPVTIDDHGTSWTPQNFNKKFEGPMTLAHALSVSKNTIAVKLLIQSGIENLIPLLPRFHLTETVNAYPSLALGCLDATVIDVAGMINVFANKGLYCNPSFIEWIKNKSNKKIWKSKSSIHQAISWSTSNIIAKALSLSFEKYKAKNPEKWSTIPVFGKTGTTNQSRTCWFAGATPSYTTVVYVGRDNNQSLGHDVYPSQTAFPIWLEYNSLISHPIQKFALEPSLTTVCIDPYTGRRASSPDSISILATHAL